MSDQAGSRDGVETGRFFYEITNCDLRILQSNWPVRLTR